MPRVVRGLANGLIYHIINRGNGRQQVFHTESDYRSFVDLMTEAGKRHPIKLLAWCIMPSHFHLLVSPERADDLSRWMQWFMTSHVRRYHRVHKSSGHVWQGRYMSFIVQADNHLLSVVKYIEGNPIRAQLVSSAMDWTWSSHCRRPGIAELCTEKLPIELPNDWTGNVELPLSEGELGRIRTSIQPFGSPLWQMRICQELGLESTLIPKGRPRKWGQEK
jgi:putative transposase